MLKFILKRNHALFTEECRRRLLHASGPRLCSPASREVRGISMRTPLFLRLRDALAKKMPGTFNIFGSSWLSAGIDFHHLIHGRQGWFSFLFDFANCGEKQNCKKFAV